MLGRRQAQLEVLGPILVKVCDMGASGSRDIGRVDAKGGAKRKVVGTHRLVKLCAALRSRRLFRLLCKRNHIVRRRRWNVLLPIVATGSTCAVDHRVRQAARR